MQEAWRRNTGCECSGHPPLSDVIRCGRRIQRNSLNKEHLPGSGQQSCNSAGISPGGGGKVDRLSIDLFPQPFTRSHWQAGPLFVLHAQSLTAESTGLGGMISFRSSQGSPSTTSWLDSRAHDCQRPVVVSPNKRFHAVMWQVISPIFLSDAGSRKCRPKGPPIGTGMEA